jgi:hypothetical protein
MATKSSKKGAATRKAAPKKKVASRKSAPAKKKAASKKTAPINRTNGKFVITTKDIINVLDLNIRTAQRLLQRTRAALDKERTDYVTVKEFCAVNKFNEAEFRARMKE